MVFEDGQVFASISIMCRLQVDLLDFLRIYIYIHLTMVIKEFWEIVHQYIDSFHRVEI